tara:strand:- start:388 stop:495 length:108 start_codon:yes stop_codon:yes gene_type:complete
LAAECLRLGAEGLGSGLPGKVFMEWLIDRIRCSLE